MPFTFSPLIGSSDPSRDALMPSSSPHSDYQSHAHNTNPAVSPSNNIYPTVEPALVSVSTSNSDTTYMDSCAAYPSLSEYPSHDACLRCRHAHASGPDSVIARDDAQAKLAREQSEQRKQEILKSIDEIPFGMYHLKTMAITAIGFFSEAYDLFVIGIAVEMIGFVYYNQANTTLLPGNMNTNNGGRDLPENHVAVLDSVMMKSAAVFGTFVGQIIFGIIGDLKGRKKVYGMELMIIIIGTIGTVLAASTVRGISVVGEIILWRTVLGIGIGGDYPLSAVMTSEFASTRYRGAMINAVFAMQGIGQLVGGLVSMTMIAIYADMIRQSQFNVDYVWRWVIGLGCVPACVALYFRFHFPESPRYNMDVNKRVDETRNHMAKLDVNVSQPAQVHPITVAPAASSSSSQPQRATLSEFMAHFSPYRNPRNFSVLMSCALSWFFLDVAWYGTALNQPAIIKIIGYGCSTPEACPTVYDQLWNGAVGNTVLTLMGTVPGYWFSVALIDRWGRKPIQIMGFVILTSIFVILAAALPNLINPLDVDDPTISSGAKFMFIVLYVLSLFFFQFGPNSTTFVVPGEVFPTRFRSTGHGLCAATGKLGAIVSQFAAYNLNYSTPTAGDLQGVFAGFAACMFLGLVCTYWVPETKGIPLEDLTGEHDAVGEASTKPRLESISLDNTYHHN